MTATQVVGRFLKESGYYRLVEPCAIRVYTNCINTFKDLEYNKLCEKFPNKPLYVDVILKAYHASLSDFPIYIFRDEIFSKLCSKGIINYYVFVKSFKEFLREKVNGNYFKNMVSDSSAEMIRDEWGRYRNGYHVLDFSWKENKK